MPAEKAGQRADVSAPVALGVSSDADVESAAEGRERVSERLWARQKAPQGKAHLTLAISLRNDA